MQFDKTIKKSESLPDDGNKYIFPQTSPEFTGAPTELTPPKEQPKTGKPSSYVDQEAQQAQPEMISQGLVSPDTSKIEQIAAQEGAGAKNLMQKAAVEASATQKKLEQENKDIEEKAKSTEAILTQKDQEIKDFKWDNRSLWDKSTTGQKIALLVGGFLSSYSNQGAAAFRENVQRSIDMDLAQQNKKLDALKDSKKMSETLLGQLRQQLGDNEKANMAWQSLIYQKLGSELDANSAMYKSKLVAENAKLGATETFNKAKLERENLFAKSMEPKKLGAEAQQRLDNAKMALIGVQQMKQALKSGHNTFSIVGDNPFTMGRDKYVEGLGRMQSGGQIGEKEMETFKRMAPRAVDNAKMQEFKLQQMEAELTRRIQALEGKSTGDRSYFGVK